MNLLNRPVDLLAEYKSYFEDIDWLISNTGSYPDDYCQLEAQIKSTLKRYLCASKEQILSCPPLEWHPYLQHQSFDGEILVLGTFPPSSYLYTEYPHKEKLAQLGIEQQPDFDFFLWQYAFLLEVFRNRYKH